MSQEDPEGVARVRGADECEVTGDHHRSPPAVEGFALSSQMGRLYHDAEVAVTLQFCMKNVILTHSLG